MTGVRRRGAPHHDHASWSGSGKGFKMYKSRRCHGAPCNGIQIQDDKQTIPHNTTRTPPPPSNLRRESSRAESNSTKKTKKWRSGLKSFKTPAVSKAKWQPSEVFAVTETFKTPSGGLQKFLRSLRPLQNARRRSSEVFSVAGTSSTQRYSMRYLNQAKMLFEAQSEPSKDII